MFHQVLVVGGPERWVWPAGESEGGVPAGARQQCMIISLLLWSGFCLGPSRLWPLTSSHSQTTICLRWSPSNPSISLLFIRLRPLLRSASECCRTECRGEEEGGRVLVVREGTNNEMINRFYSKNNYECEENDVQGENSTVTCKGKRKTQVLFSTVVLTMVQRRHFRRNVDIWKIRILTENNDKNYEIKTNK